REVQVRARELENRIRQAVQSLTTSSGGKTTTVRYSDVDPLARIQVDAVVPDSDEPETLFFVTYTDPDNPGHSNENKLHLKLGELCLFKAYDPSIRCVLVVGDRRESWLVYVLKAFELFF